MDIGIIIVAILLVVLLYLVVKWACKKMDIEFPTEVAQVIAVILIILALIGRISIKL